jgi:hypothetical protein
VKLAFAAVVSTILLAGLIPEFHRYQAEHDLYFATALFEAMLHHQVPDAQSAAAFEAVADSAARAADGLPGDSRPLILAGSLRLLARQPADAQVIYMRALADGERPEIDLNLGRAYEMLGNRESASAAILRAAWINPAIVSSLPESVQALVESAVREDEKLLRHHRLAAPPPLPPDDPR